MQQGEIMIIPAIVFIVIIGIIIVKRLREDNLI